jgi:hypothetical protein
MLQLPFSCSCADAVIAEVGQSVSLPTHLNEDPLRLGGKVSLLALYKHAGAPVGLYPLVHLPRPKFGPE